MLRLEQVCHSCLPKPESQKASDKTAMAGPAQLPEMQFIGLGCWKADKGVMENTVYESIKMGYRHFDCAADYGNEIEVGRGIKQAIDEGICTREQLWITSKLWNTYHRREHVPLAAQKSLDDLGIDYFDLYLIHFPISLQFVPIEERYPPEWTDIASPPNAGKCVFDPVSYRETWEAMEALKEVGKAKHIGVCNLKCVALMDILSYCKIKPACVQVELHVYLQQNNLVELCHGNGISVVGFSPLGAKSYLAMGPVFATEEDDCFNDPVLVRIAGAHRKTVGELCLKFWVQRGVAVVPKSENVARLEQNLKSPQGWDLSDEDMADIVALNKNRRFNDPGVFAKGWGLPVGIPIYD